MSAEVLTWVGYSGYFPMDPHPMWPSRRNRKFLCQVQMHYRTDDYFLHRSRVSWYLWHQYLDEPSERYARAIVACIPRDGINEHYAAVRLLHMFFDCDRESDRVYSVTPGEVVTEAELRAIVAWTYGRQSQPLSA